MKQPQQNRVQEIALERITRLFELAKDEFASNPKRSHEWIALAHRIGTRNRVRIPEKFKSSYCKRCHAFLVEGNTKTTAHEGALAIITCNECGHVFRRKKDAK
jgi:ribonuclease P protein subunit RPR2